MNPIAESDRDSFHSSLIQAAPRNQSSRDDYAGSNVTPYKHDYGYNSFGNVASRQTFTWTQADNQTLSWANNRVSTWEYDADGRLRHTEKNNYDYDAGGAITRVALDSSRVTYNQTDGVSKTVRRDTYKTRPANGFDTLDKTEYSIYSSVLGKLLTEVKSDGSKKTTNVYANGTLVATQSAAATGITQHVAWNNTDPSNASFVASLSDGTEILSGDEGQAELDPLGSNVGTSNPYDPGNSNLLPGPGSGGGWGNPFGGYSCRLDGFDAPCSQVMFILSIGGGRVDYNHSDGWALGSLGITPIYDWHYVDKKPTGPVIPDIIRVNTTIEWYISGYHVWGAMAGVGSDGTAPRRMTSEELNGARASVTGTVDDATDCRDYIAALIIRVASIYGVTDAGIVGTSPEGLFDAVASSRGPSNLDSQGGIFVEDPKYSDSRRHHAASSWEWVSPGMKQPGFGSVWMAIGTSPSAVADAIQSSQTALIIVHELMHNAFKSSLRGSDQDFAFAAADIEGVAPDLDFSNTLVASKYWDGQLAEHCKPDRLRILQ